MTDNQIFAEALRLPLEERKQFLEQACRGRSEQLKRFIKMLETHEQRDSLLDGAILDSTVEHMPSTSLDRVGNYRLLQQIGEGGFGVVYMAEQTKPVRRRVALKVIKPGMDSKAVLARFEAERQALAMMDHPNIATVFDGGVSDLGRPYFVMELVKGVPITTYCDDNHLGTKARLRLFVSVCKAVQHAHTKGVVHRDIKPSNVLVTLHDGTPVVKVIDFGVAKAMHTELTEKTLFTAFGQMIGTPQYMSPEQAEMSGLDVDTRSDVYSLGVLLYELLTGTTPLETDLIRGAGYVEMQRLICETESPRPSARISSSADKLTHIAKHRSIDPKKLSEEIRGDVDWIVMKALEKDRSRRYETAERLSQDVQNHLNDDLVSARPPSRRYLVQRYVRKQKALLLTVSTVILSLVVAVGALWFSLDATQANNDTLKQERDKFRDLLTEVAVTHALNGNLQQAERMAVEMYGPDARGEKAFIEGVARFYDGDQPGAVACLQESCDADPTNIAAFAMLAIIYEWDSEYVDADNAWNRAKANSVDGKLEFHDEFFLAYAQGYRDPKAGAEKMQEIVVRRRSTIAQTQLAVLKGESMMAAESVEECHQHLETLASPDGPHALIENAKVSLGRTNHWVEVCDFFIRCVQMRCAIKNGESLPVGFVSETEDLIDGLPQASKFPVTLVLKKIWHGLRNETTELIEVLKQMGASGRRYFEDHVRHLRGKPLTPPSMDPPKSRDDAFRLLLHCYLDPNFAAQIRGRWQDMLDEVQNMRISIFILWIGLLTDERQAVQERAREILDNQRIPSSEQRYHHVEPMLENLAGLRTDKELHQLAETSRANNKVFFNLQLALKSIHDATRRAETMEYLETVVDVNAAWLHSSFFAQLLKLELEKKSHQSESSTIGE